MKYNYTYMYTLNIKRDVTRLLTLIKLKLGLHSTKPTIDIYERKSAQIRDHCGF